ncbi:hypothetical protein EDB85DRAFT_2147579 [Lactarius pseudohatsudake]|nr:hypothetical protein EDB85DRAFT_2147579 [Lactarius pseudohatsudake]
MSTCRPARSLTVRALRLRHANTRTRARRYTSNFLADRPTRRTDDHYIIALTDANFGQYRITSADLGCVMNVSSESQDGVDMHLRGLGDGVVWTPLAFATPSAERPISQPLPASVVDRDKRHFLGRAFLVTNSADIPKVLRGLLSTTVDR